MKSRKHGIAKKLIAAALASASLFAVSATGTFAYSDDNPYGIGEMITWQTFRYPGGGYFDRKSFRRGDINEDGVISLADYIYLVNQVGYWSWWDCFRYGHREYVDINNDWVIDYEDAQILLNYIYTH